MKTENKPTGYEYSRKWFAFCLENPAKVNPNHSALFYWLVELNNQLGWAAEFAAPSIFSMAAIGMKSYNTYSKTLKELVEFGFVRVVRPSVNQYTACIIALSNFDGAQYEALEWALNGHRREHLPKQLKGMEQSKEDISKVQTLNNKVQTLNNTNTEPSACVDLDEKRLGELKDNAKPVREKKASEKMIPPTIDEFIAYAKVRYQGNFSEIENSVKYKFMAWTENNWSDGNGKPIMNWKTTFLNAIQFLKKEVAVNKTSDGRPASSLFVNNPKPSDFDEARAAAAEKRRLKEEKLGEINKTKDDGN
jgi:hypothetical protein